MYHRWHFNHPYLILAMVLLAVWVVVYTVSNFGGFEFTSLFAGPTEYAAAPASEYVGAPGYRVPMDYFVQEKTYFTPESMLIELAPGYVVPRDYFMQEKTFVAPESYMMTVSPGYVVPRDYFVQEKRYVAPASDIMTISPGYVVPRDYFLQEKMYRAPDGEAQS